MDDRGKRRFDGRVDFTRKKSLLVMTVNVSHFLCDIESLLDTTVLVLHARALF